MNAKVKYIPCDIYKRGISVFIGTLDQFKEWAKKEYTDKDEQGFVEMIMDLEEDRMGMASFNYDFSIGTGAALLPVFPKEPKEIAALAHEMMHATFFIMDYCRVEYYHEASNEPFTYLHEHLMRNALEFEYYEDVEVETNK